MKTPIRIIAAFILSASAHAETLSNLAIGRTYGATTTCNATDVFNYSLAGRTPQSYIVRFAGNTEAHTSGTWVPTFDVKVYDGISGVGSAQLENGTLLVTPGSGASGIEIDVKGLYCQPGANTTVHYTVELDSYSAATSTISGIVTTPSRASVANATITLYDQDMNWAAEKNTGADGRYSIAVKPGLYYVKVANGGVSFWLPSSPFPNASLADARGGAVSKNITVASVSPSITTVTGVLSQGFQISIAGSGFGTSRGYLDVGGTVTSSAANISTWTDTQIIATVPRGAYSDYVRVFSKAGGWSDKKAGTAANMPALSISANRTAVAEGSPVTFTLTLSAASAYESRVNLSFSGTAKVCPQTTDGCDFNAPTLPIVIPAGDTSKIFTITPTADGVVETVERMTVTIAGTGTGYRLGTVKTASVNVTD